MAAGRYDEVGHGAEEDHDRGPAVQAQAEERVGLVDAQVLGPEPADRVGGDVQGEGPAVTECEAARRPEDQCGDADVPEGLIEEGGLDR